jgi:hypothetical protein
MFADLIFTCATAAHPFIHLGQLEFPQPPHAVRGQSFVLAPTVNGIFHYPQMLGDIDSSDPRFSSHGIGARVLSVKVDEHQ